MRALIQQQRDALEEMSTLMKEIDASHIRYRKRAVQRAQFLLLSDRSAQGQCHRPAAPLCGGHPQPGAAV